MALELRSDGACEVHEVVINDTHNMEAVRNDPGIGKEAPDDVAVRAGEIDANHLHFVATLQGEQIGAQIRDAAPRPDIKNAVVAKIAESGAEALPLMQSVFINAQVLGAFQRESFIGLAACELGVDTTHRSCPETLVTGDSA